MGAWRTTVGEKPRATRGAMTQREAGVVASEGMQTSLPLLPLPTGGAVTSRPQKRLTCWSRAKLCRTTQTAMSVNEVVTTKAGAATHAEWITIAQGHRLPPWPVCHPAVAWTWSCTAWTTRTRLAHETRIVGESPT